MLRRDRDLDAVWYDAEEDGNIAYEQQGDDLFNSYAEQEVAEQEAKLKHQQDELAKMKKQQN